MDHQYRQLDFDASEIDHDYGDHVHLQKDALALTRLARLCSPEVEQPVFNRLIRRLYATLLERVVNGEFPKTDVEIPSRMHETTERGVYAGRAVDPSASVVTVDVARAGMVPSETCFDELNGLLTAGQVRQDHLFMSRVTDENGEVVGVDVSGRKVGDTVDDSIVLLPDPMAATGTSLSTAIDYYKEEIPGTARAIITMNLIITPECIRRLSDEHPDVTIYAMRLDRGMSPPEVLEAKPGARWDEESGLDDNDYIVPGGGGFGELMNNAWV